MKLFLSIIVIGTVCFVGGMYVEYLAKEKEYSCQAEYRRGWNESMLESVRRINELLEQNGIDAFTFKIERDPTKGDA